MLSKGTWNVIRISRRSTTSIFSTKCSTTCRFRSNGSDSNWSSNTAENRRTSARFRSSAFRRKSSRCTSATSRSSSSFFAVSSAIFARQTAGSRPSPIAA